MSLMPVLFLGHGTPMNALEQNQFTQDWCQLNKDTPRPKAILCISAHWLTTGSLVTGNLNPPTIHDFGGFPQSLHDAQYPCPGAPELAQAIHAKIPAINIDHSWGLDHGSWVLLKHLYPNADIPVVQLSMDISQPLLSHYQLAQQLRFLREQQVLIIASGNIVHNIQKWIQQPNGPIEWAKNFNQNVLHAIIKQDHHALINYQNWQPEASEAVPTVEHYLPLIYAIGLSHKDENIEHSQFKEQTLETYSMTSLRFG